MIADTRTATRVSKASENGDVVNVAIGTMQYMLVITPAEAPLHEVVSVLQAEVESCISIRYAVIEAPFELGAIHSILTPPVDESIEVVAVAT